VAVVEASAGDAERNLRPPGRLMMLAEVRGLLEFNSSLLLWPLLMRAPEGDGHPVLTLPGFLDVADAALSEGAGIRHL
jgi:hypothetical protein